MLAVLVAATFVFINFAGRAGVKLYPYPCGFQQRYSLPCPTCGMTTSAIAFAQGKILKSFYIQPAAATLCIMLALLGIWYFVRAVSGKNCTLVQNVKLKYIILTLLAVVAGGWAVTLARAIAQNAQL